jgi:transcriptional regulator with XRE-family HTH domain
MKVNISETIRLIRESKGYSQDFVASKLYITQQAYSRLEKNPENMTLKSLPFNDNLSNAIWCCLTVHRTYCDENYVYKPYAKFLKE